MAKDTYPLPKPGKIIGTPYQGTHGKQFNVRGGSNNWESENAVDLAVPVGTPIYAVQDGVIGSQIGSLGKGGRFAGERLHLVTSSDEFYYGHLSKIAVKAGEHVHAGQLLGYSGSANGVAHLHFAVKTGDPLTMLKTDNFSSDGSQPVPGSALDTYTTVASQQQQPDVTAPSVAPPPTALAAPQPDVELPGSQSYTLFPHQQTVSLWQQAAQGSLVSPETQQFLQNAQVIAGGFSGGNS